MADLKVAPLATEAVSQAPTVAPSVKSNSDTERDVEKSTLRETSPEVDATSVAANSEKVVKEKGSEPAAYDLIKTATTASNTHGHSLKETQTREDGTEYPTGVKLGLINLALCLSVFLMALGMYNLISRWLVYSDKAAPRTLLGALRLTDFFANRQFHYCHCHPQDYR
jgi:hypothetical protein